MHNQDHKNELLTNGYTIIKNALSLTEVESLKNSASRYFKHGNSLYLCGGKVKPDWVNDSDLKNLLWLVTKDSIVNVIKEIAESPIKFAYHSDLHLNILTDWHKDEYNSDCCSITDGTYGVYKVLIYLQDHLNNDYGFRVRKASHLTESITEGDLEILHTKLGDVIIFDVRLTHMGMPPLLQDRRGEMLMKIAKSETSKYKLRCFYRRLKGITNDKILIGLVYGKNNKFTDNYRATHTRRQNEQNGIAQSQLCAELVANLQSAGISY